MRFAGPMVVGYVTFMEEGTLKNTFRLRLLWRLSGLMAFAGLSALVVPLAYSMFPTEHDLYVDITKGQMVLPLDINAMEPNRIYRFENRAPSVCASRVYIVKRTDAQIRFLRQHPNLTAANSLWDKYDPPETRNLLRSVRPDVFVFGVLGGELIRPSRRMAHDWFHDKFEVIPDSIDFLGRWKSEGTICFADKPGVGEERCTLMYDLAGRGPFIGMYEQLMVPPHFYDEQGRLVLGWRTSKAEAAVAEHRTNCFQWDRRSP